MTTPTKKKTESGSKEIFSAGDQIKVSFKIKEGDSQRIQVFEGVVIRIKGSGVSRTFTVRKTSFGVGVERIFPIHSPLIHKIELVKSGKVRRAKLYHLRKLAGKAARIEEATLAGAAGGDVEAASAPPTAKAEVSAETTDPSAEKVPEAGGDKK